MILYHYQISFASGANMSIIGGKALSILEHGNLKINFSRLKEVFTADGAKQTVEGLVDLPLNINDNIQFISALVVSMLPHSFIFGSHLVVVVISGRSHN